MSRWSILLLVVAAACGSSPKSAPISPLPEDKPAATAPEAKKDPEPPAAPKPLDPVEVTIPATKIAVKLVSPGKGKRAPLRYSAKAGDKQQVELMMNFAARQTQTSAKDAPSQEQTVPTIVLVGDAETKTVDKDGTTAFTLTLSGTDAREVKDAKNPVLKPTVDELKQALSALAGLTINSSVGANGIAGDVTMRIEKPTELSAGVLELVRLTFPTVPVLPTEPVAVGAKWQATANAKLADKLEITQVTDYVLTGHKGTVWTIKGTTTVTGTDQTLEGGKITSIKGTGTTEATIADGTLYPTSRSSLETEFTASEGANSMQFGLRVGAAITPKK